MLNTPDMMAGLTRSLLNTLSDSQPANTVPRTPNAAEKAIADRATSSYDITATAGETLKNKARAFSTPSGYVKDEDVLFEPGATFYTQGFQILNKGDVPVNFSLAVSKDESIDMEEFNKAFELWIVKEGDDIKTADRIDKFKVNGLLPGDNSPVYFLVIRMKETAGNEFQEKKYTGIGVTVFAVQGNAYIEE